MLFIAGETKNSYYVYDTDDVTMEKALCGKVHRLYMKNPSLFANVTSVSKNERGRVDRLFFSVMAGQRYPIFCQQKDFACWSESSNLRVYFNGKLYNSWDCRNELGVNGLCILDYIYVKNGKLWVLHEKDVTSEICIERLQMAGGIITSFDAVKKHMIFG